MIDSETFDSPNDRILAKDSSNVQSGWCLNLRMRSVPGAVATGSRDRDPGSWVSCDPVATAPGTDSKPSVDCLSAK